MIQDRKHPKRLTIEIGDETHTRIKIEAAKRNITIQKWVLRVLERALSQEEKYN